MKPILRLALVLCVCASAARAADAPNLLPNGTFDSGIEGWQAFGPAPRAVAEPFEQAVKLTTSHDKINGVESSIITLDQSAPTPILATALARLLQPLKAARNYGFSISFGVAYADGEGKWVTLSDGNFDATSTDWQTASFLWIPDKPVKNFRVRLSLNHIGAAVFDNIKVVQAGPGATVGDVASVDLHEPFDAAMPAWLKPHLTPWRVAGGALVTSGDAPPGGWYVRSADRYKLDRLAFRVRRSGDDGTFYVYTSSWRICLRPDLVSVKHAPRWNTYSYTATRPIAFTADAWHTFELLLDGEAVEVRWDGQQALRFASPADEWAQRIAESGKYADPLPIFTHAPIPLTALRGDDESFVLHAVDAPVAVDDLAVQGVRRGEAEGYYDKAYHVATAVPDYEVPRVFTDGVTKVDAGLPSDEAAKAAALPAVADWTITDMVDPANHYGDTHDNITPVAEYRVGAREPGLFPSALFHRDRSYAWGPRGMPGAVRIYFNLAEAGTYTFQTQWGSWGIGWGPNVYQIAVDGQVVSREVYRALSNNSFGPDVKHYVPLELSAGPHRIDLSLELDGVKRANYMQKYLRLPLARVALQRGVHEPVFQCDVSSPDRTLQQRGDALDDDPIVGEAHGPIVQRRIAGLSKDADYTVVLGFYEADVPLPGKRLMDVTINGETVETKLDVFTAAGGRFKYLERLYTARTADMQPPTYLAGWYPRRNGGNEYPAVIRSPDAVQGDWSMKITGQTDGGVVADVIELQQTEPQPLLIRLRGRIESVNADIKKGYGIGLSFKHAEYIDGKVRWEPLANEAAMDPSVEGWQEIAYLWKPQKAVARVYPFLVMPPGVTGWFDDVRIHRVDGEGNPIGENLVRNGDFEEPMHYVDVKLTGRNFRAFLNHIQLLDASGEVVFAENCGWSQNVSGKHAPMHYAPPPRKYEPPATEDKWFDPPNLVPNARLTHADDRGKPAWFYSGDDLRKNVTGDALDQHDRKLQPGKGEYTHDAAVGHDEPGSLRIGKTEDQFAVFCNFPAVPYSKPYELSFYVKTKGATGRVYPRIIWFAQDMDAYLKGTKFMRCLGQSDGEPITLADDWTRIAVKADAPFGAAFAGLAICVDDNREGDVWIDDVRFDGLGAALLEVSHSHLGYHPLSSKRLTIKAITDAPIAWQWLDADGNVVREGSVTSPRREAYYDRHYFTVDLTDFTAPGSYRLRARQGDAEVTSDAVTIDKDVYSRLNRMLLSALHLKRFNAYIPGGHEADAMEDAYMHLEVDLPRYCTYERQLLGETRDMSGGWYDAGDEIKHAEYWPSVLWGAYLSTEYAGPLPGRTADDAADELLWGFKSFHKFELGDGTVYSGVHPQAKDTDNIPMRGHDRYAGSPYPLPQAAGMFALAAWQLRESDPALSQRNLEAATRNYILNFVAQPDEDIYVASKALLAEVFLHQVTDDKRYAAAMDRHARTVADGLINHAYRGASEMAQINNHHGGIVQDFIAAAAMVLRFYPDHPAAGDLRKGLRAFVEDVRRVSADTPWGQAGDVSAPPGETVRWIPDATRAGGYWTGLASSLALIGIALDDPDTVRLAERQLQWLLGHNFADVSTVHGTSERVFAGGGYTMYSSEWVLNWLGADRKLYTYDGMVPTLAFRDVRDGQVELNNRGGFWPPIEGYPDQWLRVWQQSDYPTHPAPTEFYLPMCGNHLAAAACVQGAIERVLEKQR